MKKTWITIGIVLLVLALALLVIVVAGGEDKVQGPEESLYKYYYQKINGGYKVVVSGEFPAGSSWQTYIEGQNVSSSIKRQNESKAVFEVKTIQPGFGKLYFSLENNSSLIPNRQYEIIIETNVDFNNNLSFDSFSHIVPTPLRKGSVEGISYELGELVDGSLQAIIYSSNPEKWTIVKDQIADYSVEKISSDDYVSFSIKRISDVNQTIYISHDGFDNAVKLEIYTDNLNHLRINHCSIVNYINDTYSRLEDDYFMLIGETKLPEEAVVNSRSTTYWISKDDGVTGNYVGVLSFSMYDTDWILYTSDTASLNDLSADLLAKYPKPSNLLVKYPDSTVTRVKNIKVNLFIENTPLCATWESQNGYRYLLVGGNVEVFENAVTAIVSTVK